ncbi:Olfactory receptor 9A4 [Vulpes lagopus]
MVLVVTPFLNPFIFTLRNDKFIEAFRDVMKCCYHLHKG